MPRALVVLADGFEEIEAITPIDVLRRAGIEVVTAGLTGRRVTGGHAVVLEADTTLAEAPADIDVVVLPGGARGAEALSKDPRVAALAERVHAAGKRVAAICASPGLVLGASKVLKGKRATCYPGFEKHFGPDVKRSEERVVVDGTLVTSRGPGTALEFALTLVEQLVSKEKASELRRGMLAGP
jgi:4-methyl-5(b-hydroxyethyl)-thiazole monophosphate biosynthesis